MVANSRKRQIQRSTTDNPSTFIHGDADATGLSSGDDYDRFSIASFDNIKPGAEVEHSRLRGWFCFGHPATGYKQTRALREQ